MSSPKRAKAGMRILPRGYLSDARSEAPRALKHWKHASRIGYDSSADRYNRDAGCADQNEKHEVPYNMLAEWKALYERRQRESLPVYTIPHEVRHMKHARWKCRSTDAGSRQSAPRHWNHEEPNIDGEVEHVSWSSSSWSWHGLSWGSSSWSGRWQRGQFATARYAAIARDDLSDGGGMFRAASVAAHE